MTTVVEQAERLSRHRANAAIVLGTVLMATQTQRMDAGGAGPMAWIVTGLVVALFLLWSSCAFRHEILRGIVNDEGSWANMQRALAIGFCNTLACAVVCYCLTYVKDYGPRDAIQIMATVGIGSALISFGMAERGAAYS